MKLGKRHWWLAIVLAGLLHGAVAALWFAAPDDDGAQDLGVGGVQISVGLAGSYQPPAQPVTESEAESETQAEPPLAEQAPPLEPEPVEPPIAEAEPEPVAEPPEPVKQAVDRPKPVSKPKKIVKTTKVQTPKVTKQSQPVAQPPITQATVAEAAAESRPATLATGVGQRIETGGDPAARQGYYAQLMAQIARHKRYPRSARREGITGVAEVTFVIAADGTLQTQLLKRSSGDERLDKEALEMLTRASPFPPIPKNIGTGPLKLTLPIEFSLHR